MRADRRAGPSDQSRALRHVGHDAGVEKLAELRIFDLPYHSAIADLRVRGTLRRGVDLGAGNVCFGQAPVHLGGYRLRGPGTDDAVEVGGILYPRPVADEAWIAGKFRLPNQR